MSEAKKDEPTVEFMIMRTCQLGDRQAMQINLNVFKGEDDKSAMARMGRAERMFQLVLKYQTVFASHETLEVERRALQNAVEHLEGIRKKQKESNVKLKPEELSRLATLPKQIQQQSEKLQFMEKQIAEFKVDTKDFG